MNLINFGIGVDIENVERFLTLNCKRDKTFLDRIFTPNELKYCFSKSNVSEHLAARYAGKESIIKALTNLSNRSIQYNQIEIVNDRKGVPKVKIINKGFGKFIFFLSLSHTRDNAIAFVIIIKGRKLK